MSALLSAGLLALAGFAGLAAGMRRHQAGLVGASPGKSAVRVVRLAGMLLLAGSVWLAADGRTLSMGVTIWFGLAMLSALALGLSFTYCVRRCLLGLVLTALCAGLLLAGLRAG